MLDRFHANIEEGFVGKPILRAGDKLGYLHIGVNNRGPPGWGPIPWTEIGAALRQTDYQGTVVMKASLVRGGEVRREMKVYRDLRVGLDLDDETRKAIPFAGGVLR